VFNTRRIVTLGHSKMLPFFVSLTTGSPTIGTPTLALAIERSRVMWSQVLTLAVVATIFAERKGTCNYLFFPEGTCATAGASDRRWPARRRWRPQDHRAARENAGLRRLIDHHTNQVAFVVAQPPGASWRLCEAFSCACLKR
jgi:hypothetical protein